MKSIPKNIFVAWLVVVVAGLFVPLMDNDSAHHANIALRMYLTGDFVSLVDYDGPYLDKPHLHFWLSAFSYHLFGVNGFAYKFPSFIISLMGIWGVFRAASLLISESAGRIAGLVFATSAAFLLGLNDVRMDAILTAAISISVWQLAGYIKTRGWQYVFGVALGLAMGFSTKGYLGVFIPGLFFLAFCFFEGRWSLLFDTRWLVGVLVFFLFISPVLVAYYLQYNLHPETVVRGQDHINGIQFILWDQTIGRYSGEMGGDAKSDRLFFFHTFLWAFAPWSLVGVFSIIKRGGIKKISTLSKVVLTTLLVFGVLIGFSSFKLPHYVNVILPLSSIWVADQLVSKQNLLKIEKWAEWLMWVLVGLFAGLLLIWWFPDQPAWFWFGFLVLLTALFYYIKTVDLTPSGLVVRVSASVLVLFWMMNAGFYRSLLEFQGGTQLAYSAKENNIGLETYSLQGCYSSSYYFNTKSIRRGVSIQDAAGVKGYLLYDIKQEPELLKAGVVLSEKRAVVDYEITKLSAKFLNPDSRASVCTKLVLAKIN